MTLDMCYCSVLVGGCFFSARYPCTGLRVSDFRVLNIRVSARAACGTTSRFALRGFGVSALKVWGFRIFGVRAQGSGSRFPGSGFKTPLRLEFQGFVVCHGRGRARRGRRGGGCLARVVGFRVSGIGVSGIEFRGFGYSGIRFRVSGIGVRVSSIGVSGIEFRLSSTGVSGIGVSGIRFRVSGFGVDFQSSSDLDQMTQSTPALAVASAMFGAGGHRGGGSAKGRDGHGEEGEAHGTYKTATITFWPWLSGEIP